MTEQNQPHYPRVKLAIACRTIIVLFEKNNSSDDTMAYDYAYKLMTLFANPSNLDSNTFDNISKNTFILLNKNPDDKRHPFHDALIVKLSRLPNAGKLNDKAGWCQFAKEHGLKAFGLLGMAEEIEKKISEQFNEKPRAPKTLKEANSMRMLSSNRTVSEC